MTAPDWCLIFDCDGTLVDTESLLADEIATAFNTLGFPFTASDYLQTYRGTAFDTIVEQLKQRHGSIELTAAQTAEAQSAMRVRLRLRMKEEMTLIDGALDMLKALEHIPHCIASNGPGDKIRLSMQMTGLSRFFGNRLYSGYDMKCWKPAPDMFLKAAQELGSTPKCSIVIDDTMVGVQAGLAAGMHTVHFKAIHPEESTPDGAIPLYSLRDLPAVVDRIMATHA